MPALPAGTQSKAASLAILGDSPMRRATEQAHLTIHGAVPVTYSADKVRQQRKFLLQVAKLTVVVLRGLWSQYGFRDGRMVLFTGFQGRSETQDNTRHR